MWYLGSGVVLDCIESWPRGYQTWVQSRTQNKAQWLAACGRVSASSQPLRFILSLRMNSSFITSRPDLCPFLTFYTVYHCSLYLIIPKNRLMSYMPKGFSFEAVRHDLSLVNSRSYLDTTTRVYRGKRTFQIWHVCLKHDSTYDKYQNFIDGTLGLKAIFLRQYFSMYYKVWNSQKDIMFVPCDQSFYHLCLAFGTEISQFLH